MTSNNSISIIQNNFRKYKFLKILNDVFDTYLIHGSRSSKKVDKLHNYIKSEIEKSLSNEYKVLLEQNVKSCNINNRKKCDIVIYKNKELYAILPVKFIMTSYMKNKNNSWENLTGEITHLKWCNENIHIIPINIIFDKIPVLKGENKIIKSYENITYENSFKIYDKLVEYNLTYDIINYIIDVEHLCKIGEEYNKRPVIKGFNYKTPYRSFYNIFNKIK
tara:strand:+ start:198 stop:857 length:660 start_codon:yes stop_codon:yes gene_type:complete